jgi:hypothetical protein
MERKEGKGNGSRGTGRKHRETEAMGSFNRGQTLWDIGILMHDPPNNSWGGGIDAEGGAAVKNREETSAPMKQTVIDAFGADAQKTNDAMRREAILWST